MDLADRYRINTVGNSLGVNYLATASIRVDGCQQFDDSDTGI